MSNGIAPLSAVRVDPLVMRRRQREYLDAIKPFVEAKTKIYSVNMPTVIIHPNGEIEHRYNFTAEEKEAMRLADEAIDYIKSQAFEA